MKLDDVIGHIRAADDITFVIGAGASKSAGIPMAAELVKTINKDYAHCLGLLTETDRQDYGKAMGALSPGNRKSLIQPLLDKSKINWGHIALASVVKGAEVRRVLSFNFDFLLERAAALLGEHLPVYDFAVSPARDVHGLADKAIFHLHGQSYGLRLLNSAEETESHTNALRPLITDSVTKHLTIVIGYSGVADSAFQVMEDAFNSNHNLIWLGYSKEPAPHLQSLLAKDFADYVGGCDFDLAMIEIARGVGCWLPEILENPPLHVLGQIASLPDYPLQDDKGIDTLTTIRGRLTQASTVWGDETPREGRTAEAFMAGEEPEPADDTANLSADERKMRAWGLVKRANKDQRLAADLSGDERAVRFAKAYEGYASAVDIKPDMHEAFSNWGNALSEEAKDLSGDSRAAKLAEAGRKCEQAIKFKPDMHEAFYNWGNALFGEAKDLSGDLRAAKLAEAGRKYEQAIKIKPDKHAALNNWGIALNEEAKDLSGDLRATKLAEARRKYEQVIKIKPDLPEAFNNWGLVLFNEAKDLSGLLRAAKLAEARQKHEQAIKIKPDYQVAFCNWGNALFEEAKDLSGDLREAKIAEAGRKCEQAIKIKPDMHEAFENWTAVLIHSSYDLSGTDRVAILDLAEEKCRSHIQITGTPQYNLACIHALQGKDDLAFADLEACLTAGTLPTADHLATDTDMDALRDDPRFQALLDRLTPKA